MRLTVLGSTELVEEGVVRAAGAPKQRILLTALAMNADRVVSTDALTERVWPEGALASAHGSLQVYVSNLRRVLEREKDRGRPRRLVSAGDGYGLMTQGLELDVREQHVQAGRDLSARGVTRSWRRSLTPPTTPLCRCRGGLRSSSGCTGR
jgi:DNA-binding SARP family transcriptional activator